MGPINFYSFYVGLTPSARLACNAIRDRPPLTLIIARARSIVRRVFVASEIYFYFPSISARVGAMRISRLEHGGGGPFSVYASACLHDVFTRRRVVRFGEKNKQSFSYTMLAETTFYTICTRSHFRRFGYEIMWKRRPNYIRGTQKSWDSTSFGRSTEMAPETRTGLTWSVYVYNILAVYFRVSREL